MKVTLKRNWFAPGGEFYRAEHSPIQMPDSLKSFLPKDAKMHDPQEPVVVKPPQKKEVLRDFDSVRAAEEAKPT